jgi:tetratricopeptide (TPR) repeat protein
MKRGLFYLFLLFIFLGVIAILLWHFNFLKLQESEVYQPSQEFKPAFEALEADSPMDNPEYDLEETVRAMNALEVAQCHSADFVSYLEYVARQDFSRVAPEVLEQKKKLFPILQRLYELQKEHKELNDVWMLMRSATSGASSFVEEVNPIGVIGSMITGDPLTGTVSVAGGVDKAQEVAFEEYEKQKDLKKSLEREMEALRLKYVEYLEGYAPIYHKYMQEWNALCLVKDKAYLDLYGGDPIDAYNRTEEILKSYPENREALLLKSLALIEIASNFSPAADSSMVALTPSFQADLNSESKPKQSISEFFVEAESTLDNYIQLYPARSAPALVLKGLLYRSLGDNAKAINFFDQASVEYPRQAAALTDLLDSYKSRAYLNSSAEGKYLLRLYRSTMEGFGIFSPNLLKAKYFAQQGDVENCKEEIFNHFFRRGNQGVYDCLLSDMQYCEENMYSSFKQILLEQSFLDVAVEPVTNWHLGDKDDEIKVVINNRSDIDLENVRIFLCLHYTDMYKDEYDVQKLPSVNIIKHNDKTEIGVVKLNYENKRYNDITRIRAIAMTDDKICWIDNVDYKYMKASEMAVKENKSNSHLATLKQQLLEDFDINNDKLLSIIEDGIKIYASVSDGNLWHDMKNDVKNLVTGKDKNLRVELPRILSIIDPVFSINEINSADKSIRPTENYLSGSNICLEFDFQPNEEDSLPLYIYSDFADFKVELSFNDGKPSVKKVVLL